MRNGVIDGLITWIILILEAKIKRLKLIDIRITLKLYQTLEE